MADVVTTAHTVIFIGILLMIGALVFAYVADPMGDQWYPNETVIAAGCSDDNTSTELTLCSGTVDHPSIENVTRANPVAYNCTSTRTSCQLMTYDTHFNVTMGTGLIHIATNDLYNGTIFVSYWSDTALAGADNAQQSITGTVYGGFDLATVMVIVMAAAGIIGTIFLIGRREG